MVDVFKAFDSDGDGTVTCEEFARAVLAMDLGPIAAGVGGRAAHTAHCHTVHPLSVDCGSGAPMHRVCAVCGIQVGGDPTIVKIKAALELANLYDEDNTGTLTLDELRESLNPKLYEANLEASVATSSAKPKSPKKIHHTTTMSKLARAAHLKLRVS